MSKKQPKKVGLKPPSDPKSIATQAAAAAKPATKVGGKETTYQLPPFSVCAPKKKAKVDWEKMKKETARRQAPEGEDINQIKRVLKEVKDRGDVTVHEFITLVGPYTGDNGACMRKVLTEDLETFRKIARKVYETMTQDVSDVLVNEQLQMMQYYTEKHDNLTHKMMRAVNEIYDMVPDFDFEKYLADKEKYLEKVLPLPGELVIDEAAIEMQRRQAAYHRLQWLRSEGERMNEENKRLQRRLDELKTEQQMEQNRAAEAAVEAENKRQQLVEQESLVKDKLEKLNESVEKSFVDNEANITKAHNKVARQASTGAVKKTVKRKKPKKPQWSAATAADIEETAAQEALAEEVSKAPSAASKTSFRRPQRRQSPHFSPVKTPPARDAPKERSPFHFSPAKSPPQGNTSPFHWSPPASPEGAARPPICPRPMETKIEETATTMQQKRPSPPRGGRAGQAPRDSWGGFY